MVCPVFGVGTAYINALYLFLINISMYSAECHLRLEYAIYFIFIHSGKFLSHSIYSLVQTKVNNSIAWNSLTELFI